MNAALTRFRVAAYAVGVFLLLLVVASVMKRVFHREAMVTVVSPIHGLLYMVYLVLAFKLGVQARWPLRYTVGVLLAGMVPFLSFYVERRVTRRVRETAPAGVSAP